MILRMTYMEMSGATMKDNNTWADLGFQHWGHTWVAMARAYRGRMADHIT